MDYGGNGIVAGGDVTLIGEKREVSPDDWWFSCVVRSGLGDYCAGIPFKFSDDGDGRTLTANTAAITGQDASNNLTPPNGGYAARWAMELQANDRAILDDCRLGWYNETPLFNGGYYKITNPFNIWGTNANATALDGNQWNP